MSDDDKKNTETKRIPLEEGYKPDPAVKVHIPTEGNLNPADPPRGGSGVPPKTDDKPETDNKPEKKE